MSNPLQLLEGTWVGYGFDEPPAPQPSAHFFEVYKIELLPTVGITPPSSFLYAARYERTCYGSFTPNAHGGFPSTQPPYTISHSEQGHFLYRADTQVFERNFSDPFGVVTVASGAAVFNYDGTFNASHLVAGLPVHQGHDGILNAIPEVTSSHFKTSLELTNEPYPIPGGSLSYLTLIYEETITVDGQSPHKTKNTLTKVAGVGTTDLPFFIA